MAALKIKIVKGHEYFYWRKRVRSRKKFGGTGQTRTIDCLIGTTPIGNWLPYRLWTGEVKPEEYTEAVIKWLCPDVWEHMVKVSIDWRRQRVVINSLVPPLIDCRQRRWKREREALQTLLDRIVSESTQVARFIQDAGYLLGKHYSYSKTVEELRQKAREARLYPDNFAPNAEEILDECAHANQRRADQAMEYYLQHIESLEKLAPPSKRLQFRHQVISKAAKLAQDRRWLDEYQAKLASA